MSMIDHTEKPRLRLRKKPQQERSIQRLEAIMEVSIRLVKEKGVAALTMSEIAAKAGIPIGSLYQFFPEKAAIIRALHDHFSTAISDTTMTVFRGVTTREEAYQRATDSLANFHQMFRKEPVYTSIWAATVLDPDLKHLSSAHQDRIVAAILDDLGALVPPEKQDSMRINLKLHILSTSEVLRFITGLPEEEAELYLRRWQRCIVTTLFDD